jgi:hypothetical protein
MINHGNRGVPSFRIQISPFSYDCPVSCPSTVHEPPKLESHHNDNQSYNVWHNYLSCHPFSSIDEFPMAYGDFLLPCLLTVPEVINHLPLQSTLDFGDPQMKPSSTKPAFLWVVFFKAKHRYMSTDWVLHTADVSWRDSISPSYSIYHLPIYI